MRKKDRKASNIEGKFESIKSDISEARDKAEDLIRRNPFASMAVAAAAGAIIALSFSSLNRNNTPLRKFRRYLE